MERIHLRNLPVKTLVLSTLAIMGLINLISIAVIYTRLSDSNVAVDVAGRNRMLSQRMVLFARLYMDGDAGARNISRAAMDLHDLSVLALKHGGEVPGMPGKELAPAEGTVLDYLGRVDHLWQAYKSHVQTVLEEPAYFDSTLAVTEEAVITDSLVVAAPPAPQTIKVLNPKVKASFDYLSSNATFLLTLNDELVKAYMRQAAASRYSISILLVTGLVLTLSVFVLSYRLLSLILFKPLLAMAHASRQIAQGDYNHHLEYQGHNELALLAASLNILFNKFRKASAFVDAFGKGNYQYQPEEFTQDENFVKDSFITSLVETQRVLKDADTENKRRNWTNEGFTRFSEILRHTENGFGPLGRTLVMELTEYLEANQGGLFIANTTDPDHPYLEMVACYAYNREKFVEKRMEVGEGLIGEVYQEGVTKYMKVIPRNYIHITSGLGSATPACLVIVPLKLNDQVLGVIELASFTALKREVYRVTNGR